MCKCVDEDNAMQEWEWAKVARPEGGKAGRGITCVYCYSPTEYQKNYYINIYTALARNTGQR